MTILIRNAARLAYEQADTHDSVRVRAAREATDEIAEQIMKTAHFHDLKVDGMTGIENLVTAIFERLCIDNDLPVDLT